MSEDEEFWHNECLEARAERNLFADTVSVVKAENERLRTAAREVITANAEYGTSVPSLTRFNRAMEMLEQAVGSGGGDE